MSKSSSPIDAAGRPLADDFALGLNPLVNCASHLLAEIVSLRVPCAEGSALGCEGRRELCRRLQDGLRGFENAALGCGFDPSLVRAAGCLLRAALDESMGASSPVSAMHSCHAEAGGAERFFRIVENSLRQPAEGLLLLELACLLLDLGFEGRYRLRPEGCCELKRLRERVYREVCALRMVRPGGCG
jgi:type VI secretion system protein ImpK